MLVCLLSNIQLSDLETIPPHNEIRQTADARVGYIVRKSMVRRLTAAF